MCYIIGRLVNNTENIVTCINIYSLRAVLTESLLQLELLMKSSAHHCEHHNEELRLFVLLLCVSHPAPLHD